jgi:CubicO group peptidase (beta-lactamase class C family)
MFNSPGLQWEVYDLQYSVRDTSALALVLEGATGMIQRVKPPLYIVAFAWLLLDPQLAPAQDERISDWMTQGWRTMARVDYVKPPRQKTDLQFETEEKKQSDLRLIQLDRAAEIRMFLPGSRAALMSQNRVVILEKYLSQKASKDSTPIGNSMSKSLVSLTLGKALCDGSIKTLDEPAARYAKELESTSWGAASIRDILRMSSGAFRSGLEAGSGFKDKQDTEANRGLYTGELRQNYLDMMRKLDEKVASPGTEFNYSNHDTNALVLIIEAATGTTFADYFEKFIWREVGAEKDGAWMKNNRGQVAGYIGFSATPQDWLRLGHYVLDEMKRPGCFSDYLKEATREQIRANWTSMKSYGYQIWVNCTKKPGSFCFLGWGGQQLILHPETETVLYVHGTANNAAAPWREIFERY